MTLSPCNPSLAGETFSCPPWAATRCAPYMLLIHAGAGGVGTLSTCGALLGAFELVPLDAGLPRTQNATFGAEVCSTLPPDRSIPGGP